MLLLKLPAWTFLFLKIPEMRTQGKRHKDDIRGSLKWTSMTIHALCSGHSNIPIQFMRCGHNIQVRG